MWGVTAVLIYPGLCLVTVPARRRWLSVLAAVLIAVFTLWTFVQPGGPGPAAVMSDLSSPVAGYLAAVACALAARRGTRPMRIGWALLAAGMVCTATGDAIWAYFDFARDGDVPPVSIADAAYLAQVPLTLAGIAAMLATRRPADMIRTILDGLTISASFLYVSWATVLGSALHSGTETALERTVNLAYPIGDVATASMVFIMLAHVGPQLRTSLSLMGSGLLVLTVADSAYAYLAQTSGYDAGDPLDCAWFAAFVLIGLAGAKAGGGAPRAVPRRDPWRLVTLPYVPLALALAASVAVQATRGTVGIFLYVDSTVLVILVVARQVVTLRENAVLSRRLASSVEDLQSREEQLRHLAFHDPLTGLANRALFHDRVQHAIARQSREAASIAILYVDLDGFKGVNDSRGHAAGDALLTMVAQRLLWCARPSDTVARLGGDEFAVLVEHLRDDESASGLAGRIVSVLTDPVELPGALATVGASVGVAVRQPGGVPAGELLRQADCAMYAAKVSGKGRFVTFTPELLPARADAN
ncbi:MAG: putative signaling protein [Actinomycetia bacterium]|nr:putative signaling protein [Actinomycetes bacterium]